MSDALKEAGEPAASGGIGINSDDLLNGDFLKSVNREFKNFNKRPE